MVSKQYSPPINNDCVSIYTCRLRPSPAVKGSEGVVMTGLAFQIDKFLSIM